MGSDPLTAACKVTVCPASAVKSSTFFTKVGGSSQRKRVYTKLINSQTLSTPYIFKCFI